MYVRTNMHVLVKSSFLSTRYVHTQTGSYTHHSQCCITLYTAHRRTYIRIYRCTYVYMCVLYNDVCRNDILEKEDASGMVEKVTEKWPQPENKSTHIQQQMKSVERRKTGSARGREKVLIEELARAKTSGEEEVWQKMF